MSQNSKVEKDSKKEKSAPTPTEITQASENLKERNSKSADAETVLDKAADEARAAEKFDHGDKDAGSKK